jgi:cell division protein FtsW
VKPPTLLADRQLAILSVIAALLGVFFVIDAGIPLGARLGDGLRCGLNQCLWFVIAALAFFAASWVREKHWRYLGVGLFIASLAGCVLVFTSWGAEVNGAWRWVRIPFLPGRVTVQPSEFFKLGTILLLAAVATYSQARRKDQPSASWWQRTWRLTPFVLVVVGAALIEREPDLGTATVVVGIFGAMLWLAGTRMRVLLAMLAIAALMVVVMIRVQPYRWARILAHEDRWKAEIAKDMGYQPVRSELGIGMGGIAGHGFGMGITKHSLPAATSDFIFATVAEETGFIGSMAVLLLLAGIAGRLLWLGARARNGYAALVCGGVGWWIGLQTALNLVMVTGLVPPVGIPLPFLSAGGSSLLALALALGVVQSVLRDPRKEDAQDEARSVRWRHGRTRLPGSSHRVRRSLSRV